ncbi:divergent PAP2 family protein [Candidatus Saccharibacteria bacterium]|nr:divergent PAP2 family protein [Candidatus Saccharibacteria bacterium]MCB9821274.1 divergent PAP2 family protein [Candidatus Nomurabacteria bacterium]
MLANSLSLIIVAALGYGVAQLIKFGISLRKDGLDIADLFASGGWPSSHSAVMAATCLHIGYIEGYSSTVFGLALVVTLVVVYDSIGVRRSTGLNTLAIIKLSKKAGIKDIEHGNILGRGHTPFEVIVGLLVGVVVALLYQTLVSQA